MSIISIKVKRHIAVAIDQGTFFLTILLNFAEGLDIRARKHAKYQGHEKD